MNALFAKLMIIVYGLSIAGYVLLDGGHELLHTFKNNLHRHAEALHDHHDNVDHNHDTHHHVEDHQRTFAPDTKQSSGSKDSVKIFSFLLFFQRPSAFIIDNQIMDLSDNGLIQKILTLTQAPLTPPPLS